VEIMFGTQLGTCLIQIRLPRDCCVVGESRSQTLDGCLMRWRGCGHVVSRQISVDGDNGSTIQRVMVVGRVWQHDDIEEVRGDGVRALSSCGSRAASRTEEDMRDKAEAETKAAGRQA
jgi:hypothetical protein